MHPERLREMCSTVPRIALPGSSRGERVLKRGISGTYVSVEPFHLFRYLDEQAFRYNNRNDMNDFDRFKLAASQMVGKRLTWNEATGKNHELQTYPN
jgi:hypothetical protein